MVGSVIAVQPKDYAVSWLHGMILSWRRSCGPPRSFTSDIELADDLATPNHITYSNCRSVMHIGVFLLGKIHDNSTGRRKDGQGIFAEAD